VIEAFVTNAGKYAEGDLRGEWLTFPARTEDVKALLSKIGVDGVLYEEYFITAYDSKVDGLCNNLSQYEGIDELNYLAALLDDMVHSEIEIFEAALELGDHTSSAKDLINLTQNLDCYHYADGIDDEESLGRFFVDELNMLEIPEHLEKYFDYEAYGRDVSINGGGVLTSGGGYIEKSGDDITEHYGGRDDIPEEYRIFAYPDPPEKMSIKVRLEMYGNMVITNPGADRPAPDREGR
jgi:antirestriction protein